MEANPLRRRGIALEETYFRQIEAEKLQRLRTERAREKLRAEIEMMLGVEDIAMVDRLIDLGINRHSIDAIKALPLVEVAWADGGVDVKERRRVLEVAAQLGLESDTPAHVLLEAWLVRRPGPELFETWCRVAARRWNLRTEAARARLVLEGAHEVAMASGGLFGFGGISGSERAVIERISQVLGGTPGHARAA
jgi:tellurite resistance protein